MTRSSPSRTAIAAASVRESTAELAEDVGDVDAGRALADEHVSAMRRFV